MEILEIQGGELEPGVLDKEERRAHGGGEEVQGLHILVELHVFSPRGRQATDGQRPPRNGGLVITCGVFLRVRMAPARNGSALTTIEF